MSSEIYDPIDSIKNRKAQRLSSQQAQKYSKTIRMVKRTDTIECVCDITGIVSILEIPRIPSVVLSYSHPLSILENARGIAMQGKEYLNKLEVQILSGILIVLAEDYDLFRYAPTYNGAQKNALLRTVSKDILIDAILFIETFVNSNNSRFFPALSFLLDSDNLQLQNAMQARISEWLKACAERFYKPDIRDYDEAVTVSKSIKPKLISAVNREHAKIRKEFKVWVKATKPAIIKLQQASKISVKLKTFLLALLDENNLKSVDPTMFSLILQKLNQTGIDVATSIALAMDSHRDKLLSIDEGVSLDDEVESFSEMPVGTYIEPKAEGHAHSPSLEDSTTSSDSIPSSEDSTTDSVEEPTASVEEVQANTSEILSKPMSFLEKIKALRAAQKSIRTVEAPTKQENDDAPF